jgi:hypothetical protein
MTSAKPRARFPLSLDTLYNLQKYPISLRIKQFFPVLILFIKEKPLFIWLMVIAIASFSCEKNAAPIPDDNPADTLYVALTGISDISSDGATFQARITNTGTQQILECGFVWNNDITEPSLNDYIKSFAEIPDSVYSYRAANDLEEGESFLVRAYLKTSDSLIYSDTLSFISKGCLPPTIMGFYPDSACGGRIITITGRNFSPKISRNIAGFGNIPGVVVKAGPDTLLVQTPNTTETKFVNISIEVAHQKTISNGLFKLICPWSLLPDYPGNSRFFNSYFTLNSKGYVSLGMSGLNSYASAKLWECDLNTNNWQERQSFPAGQRYEAIGFSIGGKGYIGLGYYELEGFKDLWEYDPGMDSWTQKADFPGNTNHFTPAYAYLVLDNKLYLFTSSNDEIWEYNPQGDTWTRMPQNVTYQGKWIAQGLSYNNKGCFLQIADQGSSFVLWEYKPVENEMLMMDSAHTTSSWINNGFIIDDKLYLSLRNYSLLEYDLISKATFYHNAPTDQDNFNYMFVFDHKATLGRSESKEVYQFYPR